MSAFKINICYPKISFHNVQGDGLWFMDIPPVCQDSINHKPPGLYFSSSLAVYVYVLVAGRGFEPLTFRL